jgi:hypothetical protein
MMDVAEQEGIVVGCPCPGGSPGIAVVPMIASRAKGVKDLLRVVEKVMMGKVRIPLCLPEIRPDHQELLKRFGRRYNGYVPRIHIRCAGSP